jgi:hypothetical protein
MDPRVYEVHKEWLVYNVKLVCYKIAKYDLNYLK